MHAAARFIVIALLLSSASLLVGCKTPPHGDAQAAGSTKSHTTASTEAKEEIIWYKNKLNDGKAEREFWWCKRTDKNGRTYTLIAGALASLPSSAPGQGGIEAPSPNSQNPPDPISIDFCADAGPGKPETHTLRNGFLYITVDDSKATIPEPADGTMLDRKLLPWPIIIRTPARPAGTFAGTFVLLAIQNPKDTILRESVFRPNQGAGVDCKDRARPDGDDPKRIVTTFGTFSGEEHEFNLNEVVGVHDIKGTIHLQKIDAKDPEALFLVDVCKFEQLAREVIAATTDPGEPLKLPCTR